MPRPERDTSKALSAARRRGSRKDRRAMPRQRTRHSRITYALPDDFPQRLERVQEESGLSWSEIARRIETFRHTVWRWADGRVRPNNHHWEALVELANSPGTGHLFTD